MAATSLDLVRELIAFDTTSRDSNLALIDHAQALLEKAGGRCRRTYDATGEKANLFATFGPQGDGGYVLYLQRGMVEEEFDALWAAQQRHHPQQ